MSLACICSEAELLQKLEFHFLKSFLTSYINCTQFLALWSIWGFWKWSQMIPHTQKHGDWHQNHVSSMSSSKVTLLVRHEIFLKMTNILFLTLPTQLFLTWNWNFGACFHQGFVSNFNLVPFLGWHRPLFEKKKFGIGIPFLAIFQNSCLLSNMGWFRVLRITPYGVILSTRNCSFRPRIIASTKRSEPGM